MGVVTVLAGLTLSPGTLSPGIALAKPGSPPGPPAGLTREQLVERINRASGQLEGVIERYNQLRSDLQTTVAQINVLKRQIGPLERQVADRQAKVGVIASAAYTTAGSTSFAVLLHADSTRDVLDQLMVIQLLADDQRREITSLTRLRQEYVAAQETLRTLITEGRAQQKDLATSRAKIESDLATLQRWRTHAFGPSGSPPHANARVGWVKPEVTGIPAKILNFALGQLGKAYRWAGSGPDGFDCSGLVLAAYKRVGKELPHNSARQYDVVRKIKRTQLEPGDLIFFYRDLHHVGIYIGGDRMVHAPTPGEKVRIDFFDDLPVRGYGHVT
ncbi:cell wall-associated NlpC family hydrolase [Hamadaea flava]|uniref:NlpC/P60 family protein n=1 Tax=Hamadaea flava TaxID=1742688 RepID=A0ABV8LGB7_9ACTN|nr:C40 family peptidase [Hamadaea flava]MCP2326385.1 cell wall-associated NlpC family hydrolase [Hamadaea flava]